MIKKHLEVKVLWFVIFHYFTINVVYSWLWILIFIRVLNRYKISKTIFLVDFLGDQNGQTRFLFVFSKKFLWHPKLGFFRVRIPLRDQRKIFGKENHFWKKRVLLFWWPQKINQKNGLAYFFLPTGNPKISRNFPHAILCPRSFYSKIIESVVNL